MISNMLSWQSAHGTSCSGLCCSLASLFACARMPSMDAEKPGACVKHVEAGFSAPPAQVLCLLPFHQTKTWHATL